VALELGPALLTYLLVCNTGQGFEGGLEASRACGHCQSCDRDSYIHPTLNALPSRQGTAQLERLVLETSKATQGSSVHVSLLGNAGDPVFP
jgi:hypothetical protein